MDEEIKYYPLDFDALNKGDQIPQERLEEITGTRRGTQEHSFAVLALRGRIMAELRDRGKHVSVRISHGALQVLTDEQAAVYNVRLFRHGLRKSVRSYKRLANVNAQGLDSAQKRDHDRNLLVLGKMLAAARRARREELKVTAHVRSVPGLPPKAIQHDQSTS